MNERTLELDALAREYANAIDVASYEVRIWQNLYVSKFAELIVKECINVALQERVASDLIDKESTTENKSYLHGNNDGIIDAVCAIKQHFGVN